MGNLTKLVLSTFPKIIEENQSNSLAFSQFFKRRAALFSKEIEVDFRDAEFELSSAARLRKVSSICGLSFSALRHLHSPIIASFLS